jgi:hypothetical protein
VNFLRNPFEAGNFIVIGHIQFPVRIRSVSLSTGVAPIVTSPAPVRLASQEFHIFIGNLAGDIGQAANHR